MTIQDLTLKRLIVVLLTIACCAPFASAQQLRVTYEYRYHPYKNESFQNADMNMTLDIEKERTAFYSETAFMIDSLSRIAFNDNGETVDHEAYSKLTRLLTGSCKDYILIEKGNTTQVLLSDGMIHLSYSDTYSPPEWTIEESDYSYRSYTTHKATCHFMGRDWIAWYTEEIPSSAGQWLLSGLPGLILKARDNEKLFDFSYRYISEMEDTDSRYEQLSSFCSPRPNERKYFFSGSPKEMGLLHDKIENDASLKNQLLGILSSKQLNKDGSLSDSVQKERISIIPVEYWKSK